MKEVNRIDIEWSTPKQRREMDSAPNETVLMRTRKIGFESLVWGKAKE